MRLIGLSLICVGLTIVWIGQSGCDAPSRNDIIGKWVATEDSPDFVYGPGGDTVFLKCKPEFQFDSSGTFRVEHLPKMILPFSHRSRELVSGEGQWRIVDRSGLPLIELDLEKSNGDEVSVTFQLAVADKKSYLNFGEPTLFFRVSGDVDAGPKMHFRRAKE
jgi:hypothetical protein